MTAYGEGRHHGDVRRVRPVAARGIPGGGA